MRFYTHTHPFYCGIDLHARSMYVCIVSHDGAIVLHRTMKVAPEPFLPYGVQKSGTSGSSIMSLSVSGRS